MPTISALCAALTAAVLSASGPAIAGAATPAPDAALSPFGGPLTAYAQYVFVPRGRSGTVTVIDSETDAVLAHIETEGRGGDAVVSRETDLLVTGDGEGRKLALYDLRARKTEPAIALPIRPTALVISPDSYLVAVADPQAAEISVVSLAARRLIKRIVTFDGPKHMTFSLDGSQIYVTSPGSNEISIVDVVQERIVDTLTLDHDPPGLGAVTRTADGRLGLVSAAKGRTTSLIDLSRMRVTEHLDVGGDPGRAWGTADGRLMLVPSNDAEAIAVISTEREAVVAHLPAAADVVSVNTGWFETVAVALSASGQSATLLDLVAMETAAEIPLGGAPGRGVVVPDGSKLYVTLADAGAVAVIDLRSRTLARTIKGLGDMPRNAVMALSNNYCH